INESQIEDIAKVRKYNENKDKGLEFIQIGCRPQTPKHCFIKSSHVNCDRLWSGYASSVAYAERKYILNLISENKQIKKRYIKKTDLNSTYQYIVSTVMEMKKKGHNPTVIFIPLDILYKLRIVPYDALEHNLITLKINKKTKLKVIYSTKAVPFKDIIILDKKAGAWIYKQDAKTKKRLHIDINDYEKDKSLVDILIRTIINYRIIKPESVNILKISSE
ncbi:MAG: hypothetical protein V1718_04550, partial [archaeon]